MSYRGFIIDHSDYMMMKDAFLVSLPLLLLFHNVDAQGTDCPILKPLYRGDMKMSSRPPYGPGTVANFTCDQGLKVKGLDTIKCKDDGKWSGTTPYCETPVCKRKKSKLGKGRRCRKTCGSSSDCNGASKTCQCDGWCGPSCFNPKAECPWLSTPKNGFILRHGKTYGFNVTYSCKKGFYLLGPSNRTCRSDRKWSGYSPFCVPFSACGRSDLDQTFAGSRVEQGERPWHVVMIKKSTGTPVDQFRKKESIFGAGSIINDQWVLSAAHVFTELFKENEKKRDWKNNFYIAAGMTALVAVGSPPNDHIQIYFPEAVFLHPEFNSHSYDYDVALLRIGARLNNDDRNLGIDENILGGKFTFTQHVRPVCLPCMKGNILREVNVLKNFDKDQCDQQDKSIFSSISPAGSSVVVTGFFVINPNYKQNANNLQQGRVNVIDDSKCANNVDKLQYEYKDASYTNRMFCASGGTEENRINTCKGDSGGSVIKKAAFKKNKQIKYWTQVGIVSWGEGCGAKEYGFYVSVPAIMGWLWKTLDAAAGVWSNWSSCSKTCGGGMKTRIRICEGGCVGSQKEEEECNTEPCEGWSSCTNGKKTKRSCIWGTSLCATIYKDC